MGKSKNDLIKNMLVAVAAGFAVGIACLFIKQAVTGSSAEKIWEVVEALL